MSKELIANARKLEEWIWEDFNSTENMGTCHKCRFCLATKHRRWGTFDGEHKLGPWQPYKHYDNCIVPLVFPDLINAFESEINMRQSLQENYAQVRDRLDESLKALEEKEYYLSQAYLKLEALRIVQQENEALRKIFEKQDSNEFENQLLKAKNERFMSILEDVYAQLCVIPARVFGKLGTSTAWDARVKYCVDLIEKEFDSDKKRQ